MEFNPVKIQYMRLLLYDYFYTYRKSFKGSVITITLQKIMTHAKRYCSPSSEHKLKLKGGYTKILRYVLQTEFSEAFLKEEKRSLHSVFYLDREKTLEKLKQKLAPIDTSSSK